MWKTTKNHWSNQPNADEIKFKSGKAFRGKKLSEEHKNKIRISILKAGNEPPHLYGKDHPRWKGGITPINTQIRRTMKYKLWHSNVLKRDNFICQLCGVKGGKLQVDHIKSFSQYPELRFDLSNGRTLCVSCHYFITTDRIMEGKAMFWSRNSKMVGVR